MRLLAIDLGGKRTGLAIGDRETRIVTPLVVIERPPGPELLEAIAGVAREQGADELVVGLPLNMDGTERDAAKAARHVGAALETATGLCVHFQDERLTSFAAEAHLDGSGRTHRQKKAIRDALAAAEILKEFLTE